MHCEIQPIQIVNQFEFKERDEIGESTLDILSVANRFNTWMYRTIAPFTPGRVIEIGSGIGNISEHYLRAGREITLSDIRTGYCDTLKNKFGTYDNLNGVENLDLVNPEFDIEYAHLLNSFDSLFALNVLEHIEDHNTAIQNASKLLKAGGRMLILVPAYQALYNQFDLYLEHYRRYNTKSLEGVLSQGGLRIIHGQYFNSGGIFGWFISGKLRGKKSIPEGELRLFDRLVPLFKVADALTFNRIGLSVLVVGEKPQRTSNPSTQE